MSVLDQPNAIRKGEEIDEPQLRAYLSDALPEIKPDIAFAIQQFPGGHSNLTYLIQQGDTEFILRRPPIGSKVKSAHDMGREFRILSKLGPQFSKAPSTLHYCDNEDVIGAGFYLMERVRGFILRKEFPEGFDHTPKLRAMMCKSLVETLVEIHQIDFAAVGLADLGRPEGYVQRQVEGWSSRYEKAKTDDIPAVDFLSTWLQNNRPKTSAVALIHNDFKFDNLVLNPNNPTEVLGILDWEMSTIGDPLMDLGTALSYWIQDDDPDAMHNLRFVPTHLPGMMTRQEFAEAYSTATGCSLDHILFYYAFGLFKSVGVVQQIYARYHRGITKDARFGQFIHAVRILSDQAVAAIGRGAIS